LMTPPNLGAGGGSWLPGIVVVALGEPSWPVTTTGAVSFRGGAVVHDVSATAAARTPSLKALGRTDFMNNPPIKISS